MIKCIICKKECKSGAAFSKHIHSKHNITSKDYYDKYLKQENEGICLVCNKNTPFLSINKGYQKHCCAKCAQIDPNVNNTFRNNNPQKNPEIRNKTKQTCQEKYNVDYTLQVKEFRDKGKQTLLINLGVENVYQLPEIQKKARKNSHTKEANLKRETSKLNHIRQLATEIDSIYVQDLLKNTKSSGWYQCGVVDIIKYKGFNFVRNSDIQKVLDYDNNAYNVYSLAEKHIVTAIKEIYFNEIIENSKKIIYPKELDIYLPDLKLAIEYNGLYFHSYLAGTPKNYHLDKSLMCREKDIRLIHIYEFEDIDEQLKLLVNLINGIDNYPKNDFNKNNLINDIPEPEIIFNDGRLVIYGAGFLK